MLLLLFQAGGQLYGLDTGPVMEVAPYPECTPLARAPAYVSGLAQWRGHTVPVIDLSALIDGTPAAPLLSTRLIVVEYVQRDGQSQALGLVAEKAVEILQVDARECEPSKVGVPEAPYLNGTLEQGGRLIHRVSVKDLLPASVQEILFPRAEAT